VLPGVIGVLQANEALKILVGYGDAQSTTFRELKLRRDPHCLTCGDGARDEGARDEGARDEGARDGAAKSEAATPEPALQAAGAGAACT
jgi:hypothetical protein